MKAQPTIRNQYILFGDILLMVTAVMGSYMLRLELDSSFFLYLRSAYWMAGVVVLIKPLVYYFFSMYRQLWRYTSVKELKLIVVSVHGGFCAGLAGDGRIVHAGGIHRVSTFLC